MPASKPQNNLHKSSTVYSSSFLYSTIPYVVQAYTQAILFYSTTQGHLLLLDRDTAPKEAPANLVRDGDRHAELLGELPDRAGVLLEVAADEDDVGLALVEHGLRGGAARDAADGADDEPVAERGLERGGEVCVEGLLALRRQRLRGVVPRGGDVEHVDAVLGEEFGEADGVLQRPGGLVGEDGFEAIGSRDTVLHVSQSTFAAST